MLIILEGPDLAGKSTLASRLQTYLATKYTRDIVTLIHRGPPTTHPLDEYVTPLLAYRPGRGEHIICDRWHIGEIVYPRVLNRSTKMSPAVFRYIEAFLASRGALLVEVNDRANVLAMRYYDRGDDSRTLGEVLSASEEFSRVIWNESKLHKMYTRLVDDIVPAAVRLERLATPYGSLTTYVGVPHPTTLFVGDVRGPSWRRSEQGMAFMPYPNTCGEHLMRSLPPTNRMFETWGLVNVNDVDDVDATFLRTWVGDKRNIVALGRRAQRTIKRHGLENFTTVPHPQHAKRFHHHDTARYGEMLVAYDGKDHTWRS